MRDSALFRFRGVLAVVGSVCFLPTLAVASNLTVCGIADGSAADSDHASNGTITTICAFQGGGAFTGTVKELSSGFDYSISISGEFHGSGSMSSFVSGQYDLVGHGGLYPFVGHGQLTGGPGDVAQSSDFFTLTAGADNFQFGQPSVTVRPLTLGSLPVPLTEGLGNVVDGSFNGSGTLNISVDYSAGPHAFYSLSAEALASTAELRIVPEPATVLAVGCVVLGLISLKRKPV